MECSDVVAVKLKFGCDLARSVSVSIGTTGHVV